MDETVLKIINEARDHQTTRNMRHQNRLAGYLRAIETDTVTQYHDYQDVSKGKMSVDDYEAKWGHFTGFYRRLD